MNKTSGIYSITNTTNGKIYYGSSVNTYLRWHQHKHQLKKNIHSNSHLQRAWNEYGEKSFKFQLIEEVQKEQLLDVEQKYLDIALLDRDNSYNNNFCAERPNKGNRHTDKTRAKISEAMQYALNGGLRDRWKEGWKHTKNTQRHVDNNIYSFRNRITGETFTGRQIDFYRKYDLNNTKVCSLIKGIRPAHKDWILCQ